MEIFLEAGGLKHAEQASKTKRICRTTEATKDKQLTGIGKQLKDVRKQWALLRAAIQAASH